MFNLKKVIILMNKGYSALDFYELKIHIHYFMTSIFFPIPAVAF